jgi:hypothetical protein
MVRCLPASWEIRFLRVGIQILAEACIRSLGSLLPRRRDRLIDPQVSQSRVRKCRLDYHPPKRVVDVDQTV